jgi:iron(III) transport system ATP-binding protein
MAADVAFRGRGYEHAIDIPGHGGLTSVFSGTRAERGEHVELRLDPRGCHLFSAGPGEAARPVPGGRDPVTAGP